VEPSDPISAFDGKSISYTYDNNWSFTNTFEGHLRTSQVPRGTLREHVEVVQLRDGLFFASWIDDEMGLLAPASRRPPLDPAPTRKPGRPPVQAERLIG
jgi:hypothetical protein